MNIKAMRNVHLYLGCFFAPLLILFLITGAWQMFDWHKDSRVAGGYKAPLIIKSMSEVHTDQRWSEGKANKPSMPLRYLIVLMVLGILVTTILGIVMAFKYTRPWMVWASLAAGFFIPIFLLFVSKAWGDEGDIITADRQALVEANATGVSSKIIAAKEQLSDDLGLQAEERRKDMEGVTIPLTPDGQGHLMADVLINNKLHASLIVDTGAPVMMLTADFVKELGLDLSQSNHGYVVVLNGKYKAAEVSLDSVRLGDAKALDVDAALLLEKSEGIKDGLLGMSFLSKFHFTLDQTGQKLVLRKLGS